MPVVDLASHLNLMYLMGVSSHHREEDIGGRPGVLGTGPKENRSAYSTAKDVSNSSVRRGW